MMTMSKETIKCQIKSIDNSDFKLNFEVDNGTDIETKALELLGYFVIVEAPESDQE